MKLIITINFANNAIKKNLMIIMDRIKIVKQIIIIQIIRNLFSVINRISKCLTIIIILVN